MNLTLFYPNRLLLLTVVCISLMSHWQVSAEPASWLSFRAGGTNASTIGPATLSTETDGNLAWKISMPGRSVAGPIIVDDLVVSTSSSGPDEENLFVTAVDLTSGEKRWEHSFRATGRPYHHPTSAVAAPSPVSDGQHIVAFYSSNDIVCLSLTGDLLWYRGLGQDYPKAGNDVGMASSPIIADGAVIVQVEAQGDSFAAAIDLATGKNRWRISRPTVSNWTSPLLIQRKGESARIEVVLQSREDVVAVDPANGTELWRLDDPRGAIPSATSANGILLVPGDDLLALDLNSDQTQPAELWRANKLAPRNASIAIANDRVYALKGSVLVAATLQEGDTVWQQRLSGMGGTWATPVIGGNRIYVFDQSGKGLVIEDQGDDAETVSSVELGEGVLGTPALSNGKLLIRSLKTLFCFE